jgi:nucleoid-associated protein YgaU
MVRDELTVRAAVDTMAVAVAIAGTAVLALALVAELIRSRNSASRVVAAADRLLPTSAHRLAVAVLTLISAVTALVGPRTASADPSVRGWLAASEPDRRTSAEEPAPTPSTAQPSAPTSAPSPPTTIPPPIRRSAPVVHPATPTPEPARPTPTPGPTTAPSSSPAPADLVPPTTATNRGTYVVIRGDCLWSIAARILGPESTSQSIDRGWRAIFAANRAAIGADPNLIHPGLALAIPELDSPPSARP